MATQIWLSFVYIVFIDLNLSEYRLALLIFVEEEHLVVFTHEKRLANGLIIEGLCTVEHVADSE